jgi:hypothetical protein
MSVAAAVHVALSSELDAVAHGGATRSVFQGKHVPVAKYADYWDRVTLSGADGLNLATTTVLEKTLVKQGDRIKELVVELNGPLLATVSTAIVDQAGATGGNALKMVVDDLHHPSSMVGQVGTHATNTYNWADVDNTFHSRIMTLKTVISGHDAITNNPTHTAAYAKAATGTVARKLGSFFNLSQSISKYCDYAGAASINKFEFLVANDVQDTIKPIDIVTANEYWRPEGQKMAGQAMHHGSDGDLIAWSSREVQWLVPIPLWFTHSLAQSFNLVGHHGHTVSVRVTFEAMNNLIEGHTTAVSALTTHFQTASGGSAMIVRTTANGKLATGITPLGPAGTSFPATAIAATHFSAALLIHKFRVSRGERGQLFHEAKDQLISVHRDLFNMSFTNAELLTGSAKEKLVYPKLNLQAVYLYAQRGSALAQNRRLDFSGVASPLYSDMDAKDVVSTYQLTMNNDERFNFAPYKLRTLTPFASAPSKCSLKGVGLVTFGNGNVYGIQKSSTLPSIKIEHSKIVVTPDANACTDHTAEGGISGETVIVHGRCVVTQMYEAGDGTGGTKYS